MAWPSEAGSIAQGVRARTRRLRRRRARASIVQPVWTPPVLAVRRIGDQIEVAVVSDLHRGPGWWYHWYLDGVHVETTRGPSLTFSVPVGDQAHVDVIPTMNPAFDPVAAAPADEPSPRRVLEWVRSLGEDVAAYRIMQSTGVIGTDAVQVGRVDHWDGDWSYRFTTGRLGDLTWHRWWIVPIDVAGNEGSLGPTIGPETVVRRPDAPDFTATYDEGTQRVTFAEVA